MNAYIVILSLLAINGLEAITRREAMDEKFLNPELHHHLLARDKDDTNVPPQVTEPQWEFYEVSQMDCNSGWANMNNWNLFKLEDIDCSQDPAKSVCLCGAQFSLQALVGVPMWICQRCDSWVSSNVGGNY